MNEKISEAHIRNTKIQKLKDKILDEINEYACNIKMQIQACIDHDICDDDWNRVISRAFVLQQLKTWVETDTAFRSRELYDIGKDLAIYCVSTDELNIWLQDDYNFVASFLNRVEIDNAAGSVDNILNDRFFGYEFTSVFERLLYKPKVTDTHANE